MMTGKVSVRLFERKLKFCKWYAIFIMYFKCLVILVLKVLFKMISSGFR